MRRDDPLEDWLVLRPALLDADPAQQAQREVTLWSQQLPIELGRRPPPGDARTASERLQEAYRQLVAAGGPGHSSLEEHVLSALARAADPGSVPFWCETLDLRRPHDRFAKRRQTLTLAALAYLAIQHNLLEAYAALRAATHHELPEIRAVAVHYLGRAYREAARAVPAEVTEELAAIAVHDPAFGPRFQARALLRAANLPVPLDNPGGVYIFKVKFKWAKRIFRSIAVRSEQTLDDLHHAIQHAIAWDADHLFSFFMNGDRADDAYRVRCPYEADADALLLTNAAVIGELGLVRKHRFLYYFDYGDRHEFEVETIDIRPQAERGIYPQVVERKGAAPPQYGSADDHGDP